MRVYFWDGSEFGGNTCPSCEVHAFGYRLKLLTITKLGPKLFNAEKIKTPSTVKRAWFDTPNPSIRLYCGDITPKLTTRKFLG